KEKDLEYPINQRIFLLLPLRHQKKLDLLKVVMGRIAVYEKEKDLDQEFLHRFKLATLKNFSTIAEDIEVYDQFDTTVTSPTLKAEVLDEHCHQYQGFMALKDCQAVQKKQLFQTIKSFCVTSQMKKIAVSLSGG